MGLTAVRALKILLSKFHRLFKHPQGANQDKLQLQAQESKVSVNFTVLAVMAQSN